MSTLFYVKAKKEALVSPPTDYVSRLPEIPRAAEKKYNKERAQHVRMG